MRILIVALLAACFSIPAERLGEYGYTLRANCKNGIQPGYGS